jgi:hypothetical protein
VETGEGLEGRMGEGLGGERKGLMRQRVKRRKFLDGGMQSQRFTMNSYSTKS